VTDAISLVLPVFQLRRHWQPIVFILGSHVLQCHGKKSAAENKAARAKKKAAKEAAGSDPAQASLEDSFTKKRRRRKKTEQIQVENEEVRASFCPTIRLACVQRKP
jgi:hypothetical protein